MLVSGSYGKDRVARGPYSISTCRDPEGYGYECIVQQHMIASVGGMRIWLGFGVLLLVYLYIVSCNSFVY
jgi:hypothetical protein